jgi:Ca2+-binding EF-hand superfamily protein
MSSINSLLSSSSSTAQLAQQRQNMFAKIDADGDGKVSKQEFVSARPQDVSESNASALFDKMDVSGTGSLTETQLSDGMAKNKPQKQQDTSSLGSNLSSDVMAVILQMLQQVQDAASTDNASTDNSVAALSDTPPSSSDKFAQMDTDGNGEVSQEEFVAARPEGVSEDMATNLFSQLDSAGTGSITEDQFAEFEASRPPHGGGDGDEDDMGLASATSTTTSNSTSATSSTDALLQQIMQAIDNYTKSAANTQNLTSKLLSATA